MDCRFCHDTLSKLSKRIKCPCKQQGVVYCSKVCQTKDWTKGQHRDKCTYKISGSFKNQSSSNGRNAVEKEDSSNIDKEGARDSSSWNVCVSKKVSIGNGFHSSQARQNRNKTIKPRSSSPRVQVLHNNCSKQGRNETGRFLSLGATSNRKQKQALSTKNYTDFKAVKSRLQAIEGMILRIY